nr:hypothetical protein [Streptomyces sp. AC495_CC817]
MSAWYGKTAEQAKANREFEIDGMDYFTADGGDPTLYAGQPAGTWSMIRKGASEETVENALAAANFAAAPYGTRERMYVDGVEGTHYTVKDGVGIQEVNTAWGHPADPQSPGARASRVGGAWLCSREPTAPVHEFGRHRRHGVFGAPEK